jgi:hypothetical protein
MREWSLESSYSIQSMIVEKSYYLKKTLAEAELKPGMYVEIAIAKGSIKIFPYFRKNARINCELTIL